MRIGIVGTGIAGLTAAWYLNRAGHHVTVFEKHSSLGMEAHCVEFQVGDRATGAQHQLYSDVPPRMFNSAQWPRLWELYAELGVEIQSVNPTKSFAGLGQAAVLKLSASYQPKLSAELILNPASRTILKDIGRMMTAAPKFLSDYGAAIVEQGRDVEDQLTFGEYLKSNRYSNEFIYQFLYPALSSTVCTCSYESLDRYPATTLLEAMLKLIEPEGLYRTKHGTRDVVSRLSSRFDEIHLGTSITNVSQTESGCTIATDRGESFSFDHVVVATQANTAIGLIESISALEREALGLFKYQQVETIVHTDAALMPTRRKDWATFNIVSSPDQSAAMCTILLNHFYPQWDCDEPVFQTIMPVEVPRTESVIAQARMQRPVVDSGSARGYELLGQIHAHGDGQGDRRIWYCGSYASPGIPLLESGVSSAIGISERLLTPAHI